MRSISGPRLRLGTAVVLEDDAGLRGTLQDVLRDAGYHVVATRTIAEARASLAARPVDLVLVDLGLEEGFGVELLIELAAMNDAPAVVVVSGFPLASIIAARFGVPLVEKPFALEVLLHTIDDARRRESRPRSSRMSGG